MAKATIGHGRVATSNLSGVAGMIDGSVDGTVDGLPKPADIAEQICAIAYTDGKTEGVYAAALDVLAGRLRISQKTLTEALAAGIGGGWLRQGTGQVELTAAGIYIGKLALNLPT